MAKKKQKRRNQLHIWQIEEEKQFQIIESIHWALARNEDFYKESKKFVESKLSTKKRIQKGQEFFERWGSRPIIYSPEVRRGEVAPNVSDVVPPSCIRLRSDLEETTSRGNGKLVLEIYIDRNVTRILKDFEDFIELVKDIRRQNGVEGKTSQQTNKTRPLPKEDFKVYDMYRGLSKEKRAKVQWQEAKEKASKNHGGKADWDQINAEYKSLRNQYVRADKFIHGGFCKMF